MTALSLAVATQAQAAIDHFSGGESICGQAALFNVRGFRWRRSRWIRGWKARGGAGKPAWIGFELLGRAFRVGCQIGFDSGWGANDRNTGSPRPG
jgi:hypothetical protein